MKDTHAHMRKTRLGCQLDSIRKLTMRENDASRNDEGSREHYGLDGATKVRGRVQLRGGGTPTRGGGGGSEAISSVTFQS